MIKRATPAVVVAVAMGVLLSACGGSNSGSGRLNNSNTLASAITNSAQHTIDSGTSGLPPGTRVTGALCVNTRRLEFTCDVRFTNGGDRQVTVTVSPGGRSYTITSGDL